MTPKQLGGLAKLWTKRLRLQDYDIALFMVTHNSFSCGMFGIKGACSIEPTTHDVRIEIRNDMDDHETELTLVHELCHVLFNINDLNIAVDAPDKMHVGFVEMNYERMIDRLSKVLMEGWQDAG